LNYFIFRPVGAAQRRYRLALLALAMGAVMPGRASSQASAGCTGVAARTDMRVF